MSTSLDTSAAAPVRKPDAPAAAGAADEPAASAVTAVAAVAPATPAGAPAVAAAPATPAAPAVPAVAAAAATPPDSNNKRATAATPPDSNKRATATLVAFAVQCALCYKWRKAPTLDEYESIRARVSIEPFTCAQAQRWKPACSCADDPDLVQDGTYMWALDRPDIPQPPPGWRRRIVVRGGSSAKFSDVYYHSPCGKSLRSVNDVERFLAEHPKYRMQGITSRQFSFSSPRPAPQAGPAKSYMQKRPHADASPPSGPLGKRLAATQ
ncbi:hypothetical protein CLOM_g3916 [Closterium sp. NIES-68]|nr:hypothetical protein CLOM_g3916 [Closterium sp. NIES-68]GJP66790.1 hypothetical protein CLOP_g23693 [Closterium sp. NIES-67]